jgi:hypothetical protein
MATKLCEACKREHPGKECDYDPKTGQCSETQDKELATDKELLDLIPFLTPF